MLAKGEQYGQGENKNMLKLKWGKAKGQETGTKLYSIGGIFIIALVAIVILTMLPALNIAIMGGDWSVGGATTYLNRSGYTVEDPSGTVYVDDLLPNADSTWGIGTSGTEFAEGWFDKLYSGGSEVVRAATYVVAANDSSAISIAQSDYQCTGTNDQIQIQLAIDAADSVDGGLVILLEGNYSISAPIIIKDRVSIAGTGWGTVLKLANGTDDNMFEADPAAEASWLVIRDMYLNGNKDNNVSGDAFHISAGQRHGDWFFERLLLMFWAGNGIYVESGWQHHILDSMIEWIYGTAAVYYKPTGAVTGTRVFRMFIRGSTIRGEGTAGAGTYGILLEGGDGKTLHQMSIVDSVIVGANTHSIFAQSVYSLKIIGCSIDRFFANASADGIHINDDGVKASQRIIISDNLFGEEYWDTTRHAIGIFGLSYKVAIGVNQYGPVSGSKVYFDAGVVNTDGFQTRTHDLFMDVLAVSATQIRSNEDLSEAIPNTFTLDAQPDVPRTLSGHFDAHAQITAYTIVIIGTDAKGSTITDTLTEGDGWDWETRNAYATVTSIIMTARTGTGVGDTMDIGITDVLGLSNVVFTTADVYKIKKNNADAVVAGAQVDTDYDTYDMSVIGLANTDDFTIWYKTNFNIVN